MSNIAKLKKKAAEFEQKNQYDKALELYQQVLDFSRTSDEERDVPLYNRVGDLHYRLGNSEEAIGYYEKAVDLYAEGGFFNNAIALTYQPLPRGRRRCPQLRAMAAPPCRGVQH